MITTCIKIHSKPEKRKEILQTIKSLSAQGLNYKGCLKSGVYDDVDDKNTFYFYSEWATEKDLREYEKSKSMAILNGLQFLLVDHLQTVYSLRHKT